MHLWNNKIYVIIKYESILCVYCSKYARMEILMFYISIMTRNKISPLLLIIPTYKLVYNPCTQLRIFNPPHPQLPNPAPGVTQIYFPPQPICFKLTYYQVFRYYKRKVNALLYVFLK